MFQKSRVGFFLFCLEARAAVHSPVCSLCFSLWRSALHYPHRFWCVCVLLSHIFCFSVSVQGPVPSLIWLPACVCVCVCVTPLAVGLLSFCLILVTLLPFIFSIRSDKPALCLDCLWQFVFTILLASVHEHSIKAGTKKLFRYNSPIIPFPSFDARNRWIPLNPCVGTAHSLVIG